ncbi:MAG: DUF362 domain-containing protein [Bacilli bacterium]|nr:DUF362 domain-containing protein [Bacilli bacterium]
MSKVVLIECKEYNLDFIYDKLKWGLEQLGGIQSIIPTSKKVLLKPNLLISADPEAAVTTHPVVFEAIIKIMKENGYQVKFGDSPGFGNPEKVASKAGLVEVANKYGIEQADFVHGKKISFPDGQICKQFDIADGVLETDAIINLPKMKAHALQRITGAIKNPFGCVIGFNKGTMHSVYTNAFRFAEMIIDLNNYLKVDLHIMDGIVAMEGNGPRNGDPVKMNVLLISTDPVALDTVFCKLIDINHAIIPTITYGQKFGLGSHDNIEIIGEDYHNFVNKNFKIERNPLKEEDSSSLSFIRKHVVRRPYIEKDICKKCGICVEVCPLPDKALSFKNNDKSNPPIYDYNKCIRCYCCQEMCPYHVIKVKTPIIGKILYGTKILK